MKAVRIHEYGGASVLRFEEAPMPICAADDVLIRVVGSSVNPVDWKIRQGHLREMLPLTMPFIPGWDVSGVVHAVGAQAQQFAVGDAVYSRERSAFPMGPRSSVRFHARRSVATRGAQVFI